MKEQTQTTILGILKLIPFAIVTAIIVLFWVDDFIGFMIALIFCWVTLPAIGFSIAFFIKGLRWRDVWQRIAVIWGGINVLLVVVYVLAVAPDRRCNPDIMAKHYDKHHTEMEELRQYMHSALNDRCVVEMEFKGDSLTRFYAGNRYDSFYYSDEAAIAHQKMMMSLVGLSQEEFDEIQQRLNSMECIGVRYDQYDPGRINLNLCRDRWGCYRYVLRNYPIKAEQRDAIMGDSRVIPYNEYCMFVYDGSAGAFDSGGFSESEKRSFLKKHKPW